MKKHAGSIILSILILYFAIAGWRETRHLKRAGVQTWGIIDSSYGGVRGSRYWLYSFRFGGRWVEGTAPLRDFQYLNIGDTVTVLFDPDDPEESRLVK